MIELEVYGNIRRCRNEGLSQREAARRCHVSRDTVSKYWDGGCIPGVEEPRGHIESAAKAEIKEAMRKYCEKHQDNETRKHKINAHTLWRDLHYEYPRSKPTYRRYWAELRGERQAKTRLPLSFKIGEVAEADWKMAKARVRGKEVDLHVLCVNLMYGYTPFKKAYLNEKQHSLVDGLVSAMDFYKGAPRKIFMDNMTTARKNGYGRHAELTDEFKALTAHYGIEIEFANPYEAAEKGGVEVAAKTAGGILVPVMDVESISEVNDKLLVECLYYIEHTGCVGNRHGTVKQLTEEERPRLLALPAKRYEVGEHGKATVDNQQLFKYDGFLYSVPRLYASKKIGIVAYPFRVEMYYGGHKMWECDRPIFEGENRVFAEHYLYDLEIKPSSRENAFPLLEGVLPPALDKFRKLCKSQTTKCYQLYMLMLKIKEIGEAPVAKALGIANATGKPTYEMVERLLLLEPSGSEPDDYYVEQRDTAGYAALLGGGQPR